MAHTLEAIENADRIVSALERADKAAEELVLALAEAEAAIQADSPNDHTSQTEGFLIGAIKLNRVVILAELAKWDDFSSARKRNAG